MRESPFEILDVDSSFKIFSAVCCLLSFNVPVSSNVYRQLRFFSRIFCQALLVFNNVFHIIIIIHIDQCHSHLQRRVSIVVYCVSCILQRCPHRRVQRLPHCPAFANSQESPASTGEYPHPPVYLASSSVFSRRPAPITQTSVFIWQLHNQVAAPPWAPKQSGSCTTLCTQTIR